MTTEKAEARAPRSLPPDEPGGSGPSAGPPGVRASAAPPTRADPSPPTTDTDTDSDTAILGRIAAGDRAALGELYDRFAVRVYSLARGLCGDDDVAGEVQQAVFGTVWSSAHGFDPALGPPSSWLLDLTHQTAVDALRHRAPGRGTIPVDPVITERVRALLTDLSTVQLQVLTTAYYGGGRRREVASLLGIPLAAVSALAADAVGAGSPSSRSVTAGTSASVSRTTRVAPPRPSSSSSSPWSPS